jgi:flagellar hook-basal body complex protein FliE
MQMSVQAINTSKAIQIPLKNQEPAKAAAESFGDFLKEAVDNLGKMQNNADDMVNKLASGQPVELHDVAIAVEQSSMAFQLATQVRNKMVDAYQEVMRMQV